MSIKVTIFVSSGVLFLRPAMMAAMTNRTRARAGRTNARKALLLRVGMDLGTGGAFGPIFPDGRFEYMPIPESEPARDPRQYSTLLGRQGRPRSDFLPGRLAKVHPHADADFKTATYGDAAPRKRQQLSRLAPGDLLVFYCGLLPCPAEDAARLFLSGYLQIKKVHQLQAKEISSDCGLRQRFGRTAHFLRDPPDADPRSR